MTRVLVLGVNPFEDLPGYQLLSLLRATGRYEVISADDSIAALRILSVTGAAIEHLPHPSSDPQEFTRLVAELCERRSIDVILPGTDAHLYALAACLSEAPQLALLCPTLEWIAANGLWNKMALQAWVSRVAPIPPYWEFADEKDAKTFASRGMYPLMVKGLRKGAIKVEDELEAIVARRAILRNPANQGRDGGVYAETFVDGEEHSLLVLADRNGRQIATFGFRKLAATQLGTTLAGQVDQERPSSIDVPSVLSEVTGPMALEFEWRRDTGGRDWLFEINVRFPSWIGALGSYGTEILEAYVSCVQSDLTIPRVCDAPPEGSVFYRLPQSGFLRLDKVFEASHDDLNAVTVSKYGSRVPLLWKSASPHQFRLK